MATWYYLLAERYGQITRKKCIEENKCSCHVWEQYLDNITNILPYYDSEIELSADYRSKDIIRPEKVWEPVARLNISLTNAEYVINAAKILKTRKAEDMQRRF